jgi:hypothetical protein
MSLNSGPQHYVAKPGRKGKESACATPERLRRGGLRTSFSRRQTGRAVDGARPGSPSPRQPQSDRDLPLNPNAGSELGPVANPNDSSTPPPQHRRPQRLPSSRPQGIKARAVDGIQNVCDTGDPCDDGIVAEGTGVLGRTPDDFALGHEMHGTVEGGFRKGSAFQPTGADQTADQRLCIPASLEDLAQEAISLPQDHVPDARNGLGQGSGPGGAGRPGFLRPSREPTAAGRIHRGTVTLIANAMRFRRPGPQRLRRMAGPRRRGGRAPRSVQAHGALLHGSRRPHGRQACLGRVLAHVATTRRQRQPGEPDPTSLTGTLPRVTGDACGIGAAAHPGELVFPSGSLAAGERRGPGWLLR